MLSNDRKQLMKRGHVRLFKCECELQQLSFSSEQEACSYVQLITAVTVINQTLLRINEVASL